MMPSPIAEIQDMNHVPNLEDLLEKLYKYHEGAGAELVSRAYYYAQNAHANQKRLSGEPYFNHSRHVAGILADWMLDAPTISAGLLHDVVEDVKTINKEQIEKDFGAEVAQLVWGVTKLDGIAFNTKEERNIESFRKMILAMANDMRVVLIKLADRLHNMQTLDFQRSERRVAIAHESLELYAPLAHRLGMNAVKSELEDISMRYIDPEGYAEIKHLVGMKKLEREDAVRDIVSTLKEKLNENGIKASVDGRPKHFYSIYKKMKQQGRTFDQIFDLMAVRIIVDTTADCYTALYVVHTMWKQVPNRFKDYISTPKGNMYQSLHTTVVGAGGMAFEVQIRTHEMHRTAEYGIAAHWRYKEHAANTDALDAKFYWLRQILDWESDVKDSDEFIDALKVDLFSEDVFVFTPKGDVINLPRGATPLDFAYRIHSGVGNRCIGAKINGRIVPLDSQLNTGDFVEILTSSSQNHKPSMDWLKIVKTSQAKSKIRQYFKREMKEEHTALGRDMLEREAKRQGEQWPMISKVEYLEPLLRRQNLSSVEEVYASVGFGAMSAVHVVQRLLDEQRKIEKPPPKQYDAVEDKQTQPQTKERSSQGIIVKGMHGMLTRFAKCCHPAPGDPIIGYITRGRGVTIHSTNCKSALAHGETERLVEVSWNEKMAGNFRVELQILAYDHDGLLFDLGALIKGMDVSIEALNAKIAKNGTVQINMIVLVESADALSIIMKQLEKRADVMNVYRK